MRTLIIEDDRNLIEILETFLAPTGHEVYTAKCSAEGLQILRNRQNDKPIEAVIIDVRLEKESGIDVLVKVRAEFPNVRICIMSGAVSDDMPELVRKMGGNGIIEKGMSARALCDNICAFLDSTS